MLQGHLTDIFTAQWDPDPSSASPAISTKQGQCFSQRQLSSGWFLSFRLCSNPLRSAKISAWILQLSKEDEQKLPLWPQGLTFL